MVRRFRLSRLLVTRLDELGVPLDAVLRQAALPAALLQQDRILVATEQLFAFWTAVAEVGGNPLIGLALGGEDHLERYDPIAIAALSASSFRDAVERAGRYKQLTCPEEIRTVVRGNECAIQFHWLLADELAPDVLTDLCFAWMLTLGRRGTGHALVPKRVEFTRKPAHREGYESHFGCQVRFKASDNALVFAASDLDRAFLTRNADLLAMLAPQLDAELAQQQSNGAREEVKATVKRLLAGRRPDLHEVARALGASARTLQRRLAEAGATYQLVLEQARRELAHHYLLHSSLDLSETAYLLGYEDASSFFRAFHGWEGTTPGRWRESRKRRMAKRRAIPSGALPRSRAPVASPPVS
jgi:AraC-like DNA-binding protein